MTPLELLAPLRALVAGRVVLVIGAAPLTYPLAEPADVVIAVNGGISSTAQFAGARCACPGRVYRPLVWVLNSRCLPGMTYDLDAHRLADLMVRQGAERRVDLAVLLARDEYAPAFTLQQCARQGTEIATWFALGPEARAFLEIQSGARHGDMSPRAISAGVTAAGLALFCGAAHVRLDGFSWMPGYAYPTPTSTPKRGHVVGDTRALTSLGAKYGARLEHALTLTHGGHRL